MFGTGSRGSRYKNTRNCQSEMKVQSEMQAVEITFEDTDTLHGHYQPTNHISEEVLELIKAWEDFFSDRTHLLESYGLDLNLPADLSQPPQRYRRKSISPNKRKKMN